MRPLVFGGLATLMVVGCSAPIPTHVSSDGKTTTVTSDGKTSTTVVQSAAGNTTTVVQTGDKAQFSDSNGNGLTVGGDKVPDLGVDVMPGLEMEKGSAIDATTPESKSTAAVFKTSSTVDQVAAFYREKLKPEVNESKASAEGSETVSFTKQKGKQTLSVVIVKGASDDKTTVNIASNTNLK